MTFDTETEHSGPPRVCDGPRLVRAEPALIKFVGGGTVRRGCCSSEWISAHPLLVFVLLKLTIVIENLCEHQQVSVTTHTSIFFGGGGFFRILEPNIGDLFVLYLKHTLDRWRKLA